MQTLNVPYFRQHDNESGSGHRECASSSCAMLAAYWGKVESDDAYNRVRTPFGDTTDPDAHRRALQSLGLVVTFTRQADWPLVEHHLKAGRPVCLPYLHNGPATRPNGPGHWCVGIGIDSNALAIHDPAGEPFLVTGGVDRHRTGRSLVVTRRNFGRRWQPEGPGHGWLLTARPAP
jgi:hypothetical protein